MTRVSEKSAYASINYNIGKAKKKLEDTQLRGSALKRMNRPSDDPVGNVELMEIRSRKSTHDQMVSNGAYALTLLENTENALKEVSDILTKVKEITVAQASDLHNPQIRLAVAQEVSQLNRQLLATANRRVGSRFIFGGYKTKGPPFNIKGQYFGDEGTSYVEVQKDFFLPVNVPGSRIFFTSPQSPTNAHGPLNQFPSKLISQARFQNPTQAPGEKIHQAIHTENVQQKYLEHSLKDQKNFVPYSESLFNVLFKLEHALRSNDADAIQDLLTPIDNSMDRLINSRTQVGSLINSLHETRNSLEDLNLIDSTRKSQLEDADVSKLFSDMMRHDQLLKASYQTGSKLMKTTLLDFLR